MDKNLLKELQAFLKTDQIITDKSSIQVYQRDGLSGYSGIPVWCFFQNLKMISLKSLKFA